MATETRSDAELLKWIKDCAKIAFEADDKQRLREREDIQFQLPEHQWEPVAKEYRKGRPMLSVSLLAQPMALVQNQAVAAKLGVEVHPVSEQANPDTAEVMQGLYRRIERDSSANEARLWALDRAKLCGRGWYRVNTQWDEDGDNEWDQEIVIERILHQETVFMDPSAQKADYSDARWGGLARWVPIEEFREAYPKKQAPRNAEDFKQWSEADPKWVQGDKAVLVVEFFWKEIEKETIERPTDKLKRQRERVAVKWAQVSCRDILDREDWMGQYIPLVPAIGIELQPVDGERIWEGMVRKARDGQRYFNVAISSEVESMVQEPKVPWIGAEGQFAGHEEEWEKSNLLNQPYLEYKPVTLGNTIAPPPQRAQIDSSKMMLAHQAAMSARELVQMATNVYAPSLGETPQNKNSQSGRAILALQQQADAGTSHYLQNLANVSMKYDARVVMDLIPKVYDRPGRVVQVLGAEDEPKYAMLNAPHTVDEQGRPQPVPQGAPVPENVKVYDLSRGKYTVSVNIGKSFQTRLQQGAEELGQLIQALPPQLQLLVMPTYLKFRDTPGAKELYEIVKKFRDKNFPGLDANEDGQPTVDQLKAMLDQMGQRAQMAEMTAQQAIQEIKTEQAKQQAAIVKAQMEADTKVRIAAADNETRIIVAELQAGQAEADRKLELVLETLKLSHEAQEARIAEEHEHRMAAQAQEFDAAKTVSTQDREDQRTGAQTAAKVQMQREGNADKAQMAREGMAGKAGMAREQMAHQSGEAAAQRSHEADMGARQQAHEMTMGQMPKPKEGEE